VDLAYVAHSESCALLLDSEGVCRWIVPKDVDSTTRASRELATAKRCIGAQFVATLDREVEGLLGHEPTAGKTLLFASVTNGRVALLRFGPILAFDTVGETDEQRGRATTPESAGAEMPTPTRRAEEGTLEALLASQTSTPPLEVEAPRLESSETRESREEKDPPALLAPPGRPGRSRETLRGVAPPTTLESCYPSTHDSHDVMKQFYVADAPRTDESELSLHTGSFSYDPTGASSAIASFLKDVAALAETPYSKALDGSDIEDLHTGSFGSLSAPLGRTTLESPPPPLETRQSLDDAPTPRDAKPGPAVDSELDIATGAFSRVSDARLEALGALPQPPRGVGFADSRPSLANELDDEDDDDIPVSLRLRPSGLVRRADDLSFHTEREPRHDFDNDETLRFARASGGGVTRH
jgi:hypothetical protein